MNMQKIGNPFQSGTLGFLILVAALTSLMTYWYVTSPEKEPFYLIPIFFGVGGTVKAFFKLRKLQFQDGRVFLDDAE